MDASEWNFLIASCCRVENYYRAFIVIFVIVLISSYAFFYRIIVFVFIPFVCWKYSHNFIVIVIFVVVLALRFVFFCRIIVFIFIFFIRETYNNNLMFYIFFTSIYSSHNWVAVFNGFFVVVIRVDIVCIISRRYKVFQFIFINTFFH